MMMWLGIDQKGKVLENKKEKEEKMRHNVLKSNRRS
jgi:hypothetical protein